MRREGRGSQRARTREWRQDPRQRTTETQVNNISHPEFIQIETNVACNAKCPFCPQKTMTRKPHRMADDVWMKIIDDTSGLGITYRPFMINEPLSDKRMGDDHALHPRGRHGEDRAQHERRAHDGGDGPRHPRRGDRRHPLSRSTGSPKQSFSQSRVGVDYQKTVERTLKFIRAREEARAARSESKSG